MCPNDSEEQFKEDQAVFLCGENVCGTTAVSLPNNWTLALVVSVLLENVLNLYRTL